MLATNVDILVRVYRVSISHLRLQRRQLVMVFAESNKMFRVYIRLFSKFNGLRYLKAWKLTFFVQFFGFFLKNMNEIALVFLWSDLKIPILQFSNFFFLQIHNLMVSLVFKLGRINILESQLHNLAKFLIQDSWNYFQKKSANNADFQTLNFRGPFNFENRFLSASTTIGYLLRCRKWDTLYLAGLRFERLKLDSTRVYRDNRRISGFQDVGNRSRYRRFGESDFDCEFLNSCVCVLFNTRTSFISHRDNIAFGVRM